MATSRQKDKAQHILLVGASGLSGLAFIQQYLELSAEDDKKPYLTLYIRASGRSKLAAVLPSAMTSDSPAARIRIMEGDLSDRSAIRKALSADDMHPKVSTVVSVLGAYMSLYYFFTRTKPTPITDAMNDIIIPVMLELNIKRILVLSTPSAFPVHPEQMEQSWGWYFHKWMPVVVVPQAHAEMKGIAHAVLDNSTSLVSVKHGLEATVFRVPMLNDGEAGLHVAAFILGGTGNVENKTLSRRSLARWLFNEVEEKQWVNGAPLLCNEVAQ